MIQSVLFKSPYSGCSRFSGWPPEQCGQKPLPFRTASKPLGQLFCVDRVSKPAGAQNVQETHFRPAMPYPRYVFGPGGEPVKPMPPPQRRKVYPPPYNLHPVKGPSHAGPFTYFNAWDPWIGEEDFGSSSLGAAR